MMLRPTPGTTISAPRSEEPDAEGQALPSRRRGADSLAAGRQMIAKKISAPTPEEAENIRRSVATHSHGVEDYKTLMAFLGIEPQRGGKVLWWK